MIKNQFWRFIYKLKEKQIMKTLKETKIKITKDSEWITSKKDEKIYITKLEIVKEKGEDFWGLKK